MRYHPPSSSHLLISSPDLNAMHRHHPSADRRHMSRSVASKFEALGRFMPVLAQMDGRGAKVEVRRNEGEGQGQGRG